MQNFQVRNAEIEGSLREIASAIAGELPDGWGFALFLFSFGEGGSTFYISNAQRDDMLKALEEFIERQRTGPEQSARAIIERTAKISESLFVPPGVLAKLEDDARAWLASH